MVLDRHGFRALPLMRAWRCSASLREQTTIPVSPKQMPSTTGNPMDYTVTVSIGPLVTVVETPEFVARADKLMTEAEREALVAYLAANPTAGDPED